ncbi:Zinc finger, Dof-type [Sesbania bispinosa]|nr:Zinc finger, Dof-type [Sesbania bispinosa]
MAQVLESGQNSEGIKLFGTTIKLHGRQRNEDSEDGAEDQEKRPDKIIHAQDGCQRYWTAGGALRNVPVGAGRRKAKPPCLGPNGFPEFDGSTVHQFGLDEWHLATMVHGDFRQLFASKRRRTSSAQQEGQ